MAFRATLRGWFSNTIKGSIWPTLHVIPKSLTLQVQEKMENVQQADAAIVDDVIEVQVLEKLGPNN